MLIPPAAAHPTNPNSFPDPTVLVTPNPATPGSFVQVHGTGFFPGMIPSGQSMIINVQCSIYSDPSNLFQSAPQCFGGEYFLTQFFGNITGIFQVSTTASQGAYDITVRASLSGEICKCPQTPQAPAALVQQLECVPVEPPPDEDAKATITVTQPVTMTTTLSETLTTTSHSYYYYTQTSTITTTSQLIVQLTAPQAIVTTLATAAVTAIAARVYAKRRPGFAFDVKVRSGIDRKKSSD
jgi:hypothetical protein